MTFRTIHRTDLAAGSSPFRVVDEQGRELEWANRFLDMQCVRGLAPLSLRAYASAAALRALVAGRPGVDVTHFAASSSPRHPGRLCARSGSRATGRPRQHQQPFRHAAPAVRFLLSR